MEMNPWDEPGKTHEVMRLFEFVFLKSKKPFGGIYEEG
jgi:hypothetical protein